MHIKMDILEFEEATKEPKALPVEVFNDDSETIGIRIVTFLEDYFCFIKFKRRYYKMYLEDDRSTNNNNQKIVFLEEKTSYGGSDLFA